LKNNILPAALDMVTVFMKNFKRLKFHKQEALLAQFMNKKESKGKSFDLLLRPLLISGLRRKRSISGFNESAQVLQIAFLFSKGREENFLVCMR